MSGDWAVSLSAFALLVAMCVVNYRKYRSTT